jgi:hypothetical protein
MTCSSLAAIDMLSQVPHESELKLKFEKVKISTPNRESVDDWLQKWEVCSLTVYTECLDYRLSDVLGSVSIAEGDQHAMR